MVKRHANWESVGKRWAASNWLVMTLWMERLWMIQIRSSINNIIFWFNGDMTIEQISSCRCPAWLSTPHLKDYIRSMFFLPHQKQKEVHKTAKLLTKNSKKNSNIYINLITETTKPWAITLNHQEHRLPKWLITKVAPTAAASSTQITSTHTISTDSMQALRSSATNILRYMRF